MTRPELLEYIETLDKETRAVFYKLEDMLRCHPDTLDENFQIVADVYSAFEKRAEQWLEGRQ